MLPGRQRPRRSFAPSFPRAPAPLASPCSAPKGSCPQPPRSTTTNPSGLPYQRRSMTAGLLGSAPMQRRRQRTRITFPSTTPVACNQEQGLPLAPQRQESRAQSSGSPQLARPSSRTWPGAGLGGSEGRRVPTGHRELSPARRRWKRWLLPCSGPLLAEVSAAPRLSWAFGRPARTPPGRRSSQVELSV